jgi:hypothetical protein
MDNILGCIVLFAETNASVISEEPVGSCQYKSFEDINLPVTRSVGREHCTGVNIKQSERKSRLMLISPFATPSDKKV